MMTGFMEDGKKTDSTQFESFQSQQQTERSSKADIYDFKSDDDMSHGMPSLEPKLNGSKASTSLSSQNSATGSEMPRFNSFTQANLQIQPFQGLPIAASNQQQTPFLGHTVNTNFILPGTSASSSFGQPNATRIFNSTPFTPNAPIRLISFQTNTPAQQNFLQVQANNPSIVFPEVEPNVSNTSKKQTKKPKASKKRKKSVTDENQINQVEYPIINPEYQPTKGMGKGNRKPRISFVSVANGCSIGADGIRRKFQCSHCGNDKSFKTKSHLQRHMLTHTGEKPYQCQECGSKFNQSSSLRNHIIAIHTKNFPHICSQCGKGFLMPAVLQKHLQMTGHVSTLSPQIPNQAEQKESDSFRIGKIRNQSNRSQENGEEYSYEDNNNDSGNSHVNNSETVDQREQQQRYSVKDEIEDGEFDFDDIDRKQNIESRLIVEFKEGESMENNQTTLHNQIPATSNSVSFNNFNQLPPSLAPINHLHQFQSAHSQPNLFFVMANATSS